MIDKLYDSSSNLMKEHRWNEVMQLLNRRTLKELKNWKLYWNTAWAHFKIDEFSKTTEYFKKAQELTNNRKDSSVCLTFIGISELKLKNYDQALVYLLQSLQLNDGTLTRKSLALAHMHLDNIEEAEQVHKDGITNQPKNKERLAAYGDFLIDFGREDEAKEIERIIKSLE